MRQRGFTLIELLLSAGIITLLVGLSLPVYLSFVNRNDLDLTTQNIANALRRAQSYARGVRGDSQWGVSVQSGQAILFKGTSYVTRETGSDEIIDFSDTLVPSGTNEVVFAKLNAAPSTTGNLTLTSSALNETRTISINAEGMVNY